MARTRNTQLAGLISEVGWSQAQTARQFVRVAAEIGADELTGVTASHINQWVRGSRPSGRAPVILCETLSRGVHRRVTPADLGLAESSTDSLEESGWRVDPLAALHDLGGPDVSMERRRVVGAAAYSVAGFAIPGESWWREMAEHGAARQPTNERRIGRSDVEDMRDAAHFYSRRDQRRGGGYERAVVDKYLGTEVHYSLQGRFADEQLRREAFAAAGELAYIAGWMAFDNAEHAVAQQRFNVALKLAAEGQDPALAAHVLRAAAHQAVDLGHPTRALELANASTAPERYAQATPRERALLEVVHARSLAVAGERRAASQALLRAENELSSATVGDEEPDRVFFFAQASLAHETACALRDMGDLKGSLREFHRSVRTRQSAAFTRTHAVTLGYLGAVEARQGNVEAACSTWRRALDAMDGVRSARALDTVATMRRTLSPFRKRGIAAVAEIDTRAAALLRTAQ